LADAPLDLLRQLLAGNCEQQHREARAPIWRLVRRQLALDAGFAAAADH